MFMRGALAAVALSAAACSLLPDADEPVECIPRPHQGERVAANGTESKIEGITPYSVPRSEVPGGTDFGAKDQQERRYWEDKDWRHNAPLREARAFDPPYCPESEQESPADVI